MRTPIARENASYKRLEPLLAVFLVFLKLHVLFHTWGQGQGFDVAAWLDLLQKTRWFEALVPPRRLFNSYHPPLSYLLGRLIHTIVPGTVETSQVLSTAALIGAFFALRSAIRRMGWLSTLPGICLLYGSMSVPLVVWLAVETSYDGLVLFWFLLAFALSVSVFWLETPTKWWQRARVLYLLTFLGVTLAAAMLTKFNGLIAFTLPFLIIFFRRGLRALFREFSAPVTALIIAAVIAGPFYYQRYYKTEGRWIPISIEWQMPSELATLRAARDAHPWKSLAHILRYPEEKIVGTQDPVADSFLHIEWLHLWKRDSYLGKQSDLSLAVSDIYVVAFPFLVSAGAVLFFVRRRHIPQAWRQLGWILLTVAGLFCAGGLLFAWKYPIWEWRVIKAKYNTPVVLWLIYATAIVTSERWLMVRQTAVSRFARRAALCTVVVFMFANHLIPVY
jgi:hypothetical protein